MQKKQLKSLEKAKKSKPQAKLSQFLNHSKLVEQELMTSHEYEKIYYRPQQIN